MNDNNSKHMVISQARVYKDTCHIDLWYPGIDTNPTFLQVGLMHVRAADDIRISYDFDRDGYKIEQTDGEKWIEVFFAQAWKYEKEETNVWRKMD
jgi:hypothetical protein